MWASGLAASLKGKFHYYSMSHRNTHTPCFCDNVANCDACLLISVLVHDTNTLMRLFGDYIRCIIPRRDWSLASAGPTASRQHCATHCTGCLCLSASFSQFRWWHDSIRGRSPAYVCVLVTFVPASFCRLRGHYYSKYLDCTLLSTKFPCRWIWDLEHTAISPQRQEH